jgi:hypothetical protein
MQDNFKCMISQCGELTAKDLEVTIIHLITQSNTCAEVLETFLTNVDGLGGVNFTCQEGAKWFTDLATFICRGVVLTTRAAGRRVIPGHAAPGRKPIYELALTADFDYDQLTPDNKQDIADFIELIIGSPLAPIPPADVSPNMVAVTNGIYQMTFPDKKVPNTTYTLTMVFISYEQFEFFMSSPGVSTFYHGSASTAPEQVGYKHSLPLYLRRGAPGYLVFRTAARSTKLYLKTTGQPSATTDTTSVVLAVQSALTAHAWPAIPSVTPSMTLDDVRLVVEQVAAAQDTRRVADLAIHDGHLKELLHHQTGTIMPLLRETHTAVHSSANHLATLVREQPHLPAQLGAVLTQALTGWSAASNPAPAAPAAAATHPPHHHHLQWRPQPVLRTTSPCHHHLRWPSWTPHPGRARGHGSPTRGTHHTHM